MPPHLHPRSGYTSSLFATTLLASFVVVGLPHLLPCPAPRVAYADGEGRRRRRRRKSTGEEKSIAAKDGIPVDQEEGALEVLEDRSLRRECPVPKPRGVVGEILGFKKIEKGSSRTEGGQGKPP